MSATFGGTWNECEDCRRANCALRVGAKAANIGIDSRCE
jgi:hypothetical protein